MLMVARVVHCNPQTSDWAVEHTLEMPKPLQASSSQRIAIAKALLGARAIMKGAVHHHHHHISSSI